MKLIPKGNFIRPSHHMVRKIDYTCLSPMLKQRKTVDLIAKMNQKELIRLKTITREAIDLAQHATTGLQI